MAVSNVQANVSQRTQSPALPAKASLDYDTFLRLLVAQMKNQDPTKPMESTEYIAQLATFSNVEQLIASNKKLDQLVNEGRMAKGAGLIGLNVTSLESGLSGRVESVRFTDSGILAGLKGGGELLINDKVSISQ